MSLAQVMVDNTVTVSEFKKNPIKFISEADGDAVAVMKGSKASFYAVPIHLFELLINLSEDKALSMLVQDRLSEPYDFIPYEPEE